MDIEPIRASRDHKKALKGIESSMMARKGTPEGDRPGILTTLVDDWERRNQPILLPDPTAYFPFGRIFP